ncbi:MAG: alpha/beta fold hydrolase [Cyclobacteriaceae bacterium]
MVRKISYKNHQLEVHVEGEGKPVLLLHGWPTNAKLWNAQRDFLKSKYQVITPDWLGFGQSDKPKDHQYSISNMVEILNNSFSKLRASGKMNCYWK